MEWDPECLPLPCFSFEDALEAVKDGRAARAIIPIENSQHGRVADIHFLLPESGLSIVGEHFMAIHHDLMALGDGPFTSCYSHPQALGQSRFFLRERKIVPLAYADTAGAAAHVAERGDPSLCAIAPKIAAELYGLKTIEENVEDAADNMTRFVVLSRQPLDPAALNGRTAMTTFVFEVKNIPAALYKAMGGFATNGVNMTKAGKLSKGRQLRRDHVLCGHRGRTRRSGSRPGDGRTGFPLQGTARAGHLSAGTGAGVRLGQGRGAAVNRPGLLRRYAPHNDECKKFPLRLSGVAAPLFSSSLRAKITDCP